MFLLIQDQLILGSHLYTGHFLFWTLHLNYVPLSSSSISGSLLLSIYSISQSPYLAVDEVSEPFWSSGESLELPMEEQSARSLETMCWAWRGRCVWGFPQCSSGHGGMPHQAWWPTYTYTHTHLGLCWFSSIKMLSKTWQETTSWNLSFVFSH